MKTKSTLYRLRPQPKKSNSSSSNNQGQSKTQEPSSQLQRSIKERQRLKAAEYSASDPVRKHLQNRGDLLSQRIADLQRQQKK